MCSHALTHLNDAVLLRDLDALVSQERGAMAAVIAHVAEVDARRLYLPAGYPSMYEYCLRKLGWSEQAALKRVRAARTARRFPVIFDALSEGSLHLSAVVLLAPHLTADNADELLAAAAYRTKAEVEELLARWFPQPDMPTRLEAIAPAAQSPWALSPELLSPELLSPGTVSPCGNTDSAAARRPSSSAEARQAPQLAPLAPERFVLQFMMGKGTYEKLRYVQALLSHQVPSGDVVEIFDRSLDALKEQLEKQKFAATAKPRPRSPMHRSSANPRYIPAPVKRAVWARDGGQCTFLNAAGERCRERRMLEFDHIDPVARGGRATVDGMRILCRAHNQYEAERRFGAGFMKEKRDKPRRATAQEPAMDTTEARTGAPVAAAPTPPVTPPRDHVRDVVAGLRALGFRASEARRAIEFGETSLDATLEDRVRAALRFLCPNPG